MTKISRMLAAVASAAFAAVMFALPPPDQPTAPKLDIMMSTNDNDLIANMASPAGSLGVGPTSTAALTGTMEGYIGTTYVGTSGAANDNDLAGGKRAA